MTHQERDRLGLSLGIAIAIHAVVIVGISFASWDIRDFPESTPVFVELLDYEAAPPVEPEETQPEEEPLPEPTPDEQPEPEPVEPEVERPEPDLTTQRADQAVSRSEPAASSAAPPVREATPTSSTDAPAGSHSFADLPWLQTDANAEARTRERPQETEPVSFDEPEPTGIVPDWTREGRLQPLGTLTVSEQAALQTLEQTVDGFSELMEAIDRAMQTSENTSQSVNTTSDTGPERQTIALPGQSTLDFAGGTRRPRGELRMPSPDPADFGELVDKTIQCVVVFTVNDDGLVVPGSAFFRSSTAITLVDREVIRAIESWQFLPSPGAELATGIARIVLERAD
jgi:hypothetical protein